MISPPSTTRVIEMIAQHNSRRKALWRLGKFLLLLLLALSMVITLAVAIGPEQMNRVQARIDAAWWRASVIRWILLAGVLLFLPQLLKLMEARADRRRADLDAACQSALNQNPDNEPLNPLRIRAEQQQRIAASYRAMFVQRHWIAVALILVELVLVQLPHLF